MRAFHDIAVHAIAQVDPRAMLVDDLLHGREAKPRALRLRRHVRLERARQDARRKTRTVVRDGQPNRDARFAVRVGIAIFYCLGFEQHTRMLDVGDRILRVLQQIVDHLTQLCRIAADHRQRRLLDDDRALALADTVKRQYFAHQIVQLQVDEHRGRRARVIAKIVDHALHRGHLIDDRRRTALEHVGVGLRELVGKLHLQALGRELDRRERILDLVREPPRDLAPRDRTLRGDHIGDVVEHDDVAGGLRIVGLPGRRRRRHEPRAAHEQRQRLGLARHLDGELLLPVAAVLAAAPARRLAIGERLSHHRAELRDDADLIERRTDQRVERLAEDSLGAAIRGRQAKLAIQHEHARGQVRENALEVRLRMLERDAVLLDREARLRQLPRHRVERLREKAELVARLDLALGRVVALRDFLRALREQEERPRELVAERERDHHRNECREKERERERADVHLAQPAAAERFLLVFAIRALHGVRVARERRRHRLRELQEALGGLQQRRRRIGNALHDAQAQRALRSARARIAVDLAFDRREHAVLARLAQHQRRRHVVRNQRGEVARRLRDDVHIGRRARAAARLDDRRILHAELIAQPQERERRAVRVGVGARELLGHQARLRLQVRERRVEHPAAEIQARGERRLDVHVEPRFDAARHELIRHDIDDPARHDADEREEHRELREQPRAELALPQPRDDHPDEPEHDQHEHERDDDVRRIEPRVVAVEELGVRARGREQHEQQKRRDRDSRYDHAYQQALSARCAADAHFT
ncbi:Uncharacterised protein [Burkholderia pseudomallei]|nr:Uncharacterised protein [Burkholderia pseudomallei]